MSSHTALNGVEDQDFDANFSKIHSETSDRPTNLLSRTKLLNNALFQRDLEVAKMRNWNDLHLAALWGLDQEVIRLIQDECCGVNVLDNIESTPLHLAVARGNTACARVLLEKGAKVDAQDKYGWTPLHTALFHLSSVCHPCITLLEAYKASVIIKNSHGDTPWNLRRADCSWK